jgi:NAD(P)-dependent dehydrogenase (short-subunit alcohol dehydrogenase family)
MRAKGGGNIINLAIKGTASSRNREWLVYETAKAGVVGMTRQMATDFRPDGIRARFREPLKQRPTDQI